MNVNLKSIISSFIMNDMIINYLLDSKERISVEFIPLGMEDEVLRDFSGKSDSLISEEFIYLNQEVLRDEKILSVKTYLKDSEGNIYIHELSNNKDDKYIRCNFKREDGLNIKLKDGYEETCIGHIVKFKSDSYETDSLIESVEIYQPSDISLTDSKENAFINRVNERMQKQAAGVIYDKSAGVAWGASVSDTDRWSIDYDSENMSIAVVGNGSDIYNRTIVITVCRVHENL